MSTMRATAPTRSTLNWGSSAPAKRMRLAIMPARSAPWASSRGVKA